MIEANTGHKPDDSMGQKMIDSWHIRYPQASKFQERLERAVVDPGYWQSLSGRIRHFKYLELHEMKFDTRRTNRGILWGLARQARNFPCQELVAATTGKALLMFIKERNETGLKSRVCILLYDAMMAITPLSELRTTTQLLRECLTVRNTWDTKGGKFHFEVDTSIGFRWGVKPSAQEKQLLQSYL
jgi:DNA polymerase I-like protein with 3'-5' exonuclease and polymerase domains